MIIAFVVCAHCTGHLNVSITFEQRTAKSQPETEQHGQPGNGAHASPRERVRSRKLCRYNGWVRGVVGVSDVPRRDDIVMISACAIGERATTRRDTTYDGDSYRLRYQTYGVPTHTFRRRRRQWIESRRVYSLAAKGIAQ